MPFERCEVGRSAPIAAVIPFVVLALQRGQNGI